MNIIDIFILVIFKYTYISLYIHTYLYPIADADSATVPLRELSPTSCLGCALSEWFVDGCLVGLVGSWVVGALAGVGGG